MINTKRSYTEYNITSSTTDFAIGFDNYGVGSKDMIEVTLDGVNVENLGYSLRLKNAQVLELTPAVEAGVVRLQRITDIDNSFHKYTAGALFTAKSMDENFEQIRHSQQEVSDGFGFLADSTYSVVANANAAADRANTAADAANAAIFGKVSTTNVLNPQGLTQESINITTLASLDAQRYDTGIITWSGSTLAERNRKYIYASDYGILGNATDESSKLVDLFVAGAGKTIVFDTGIGKVIGYNPIPQRIVIKAHTTVHTGGVTFKELNAGGDYRFATEEGVKVDRLIIQTFASDNNRGIGIEGSDTQVGYLSLKSNTTTGVANLRRRALKIGIEAGEYLHNIKIGYLVIDNWDYGFMVHNTKGLNILGLEITNFRQGGWLSNVSYSCVRAGTIKLTSPNSTGVAGENGIIVESQEHNGSRSLVFENITVHDTGEHGFRLGGDKVIRDVYYIGCNTRNTGVGTVMNHGGSGFKALGSTRPTAEPESYNSYHQNIHYISCLVEDVNPRFTPISTGTGTNNFDGFNIGKVDGFTITDCEVRTTRPDYYNAPNSTPPTYSCDNGIAIVGCNNGAINNFRNEKSKYYGIYVFDVANTDTAYWGTASNDISINGGTINTPNVAGIGIYNANGQTIRRLSSSGLNVIGAPFAHRDAGIVAPINSCRLAGTNLGAPTYNFVNLQTVTFQLFGNFVGANNCKNGSSFVDETTGAFKFRRTGTWVDL
jgi:hypothetical protein